MPEEYDNLIGKTIGFSYEVHKLKRIGFQYKSEKEFTTHFDGLIVEKFRCDSFY